MNKRNIHFLYVIGLIGLTFLLGACESGRGYSARSWSYETQTAQTPPASLKDLDAAANENPDADTLSDNAPGQSAPTLTPQTQTVKVGLLLPLSGQHKLLGEAMLNAAQIALFDIGHTNFELLPRDTKATRDGARDAARSAIQDGAELILGPVFADAVRGAKNVASSANVNVIGFSTDWILAGGNTFIMGFLPFDQIRRVADHAYSNGLEKIAILAPRSAYGDIVVNAWLSMAERYGMPKPEITSFSPQTANLSPIVRKFAQYDERQAQIELDEELESPLELEPPFDAVLMPVGGELALSIANLLTHYDLPPGMVRRIGTGLFDDRGLAAEPSLSGAWFAAPSPTLRKSFEKRYQALYGLQPARLTTLAYDATALAAVLAQRGIQRTGRPDFSRAAITNPNGFAGIDGIFRFRSDGTAERGLALLEFRHRGTRILDEPPRTFQNFKY